MDQEIYLKLWTLLLWIGEGYDNNNSSLQDLENDKSRMLIGSVPTPDGALQKHDNYTGGVTVVSTNLPSDPEDPERKNNIEPVETPSIGAIPGLTSSHMNKDIP